MAERARKDVFISYTAPDGNWAKWLDYVLHDAVYSTVVHGYDFHAGNNFVDSMDEALRKCCLVVGLLSPDYIQSRWSKKEWQAALNADRLFPIRIADYEPNGLLRSENLLDLVGAEQVTARDLVLNALRSRAGLDLRPKNEPELPARKAAPQSRRFPTELPLIWNIAKQRNLHFTVRDRRLRSMYEALSAGNTTAPDFTIPPCDRLSTAVV